MLENEKVCSCFGEADVEITEELKARTKEEIDKAVNGGVRVFLFGGQSNFDDLVYDLLSEIKAQNCELEIKRIFYFTLGKYLVKPPRWFKRKEYEGYECPVKGFEWRYMAEYFRDFSMIDKSDLVLFYAKDKENSEAYKAYLYALKTKKPSVNFAPKISA